MILTGTPQELAIKLGTTYPAAIAALQKSSVISAQLLNYQALALYVLASRYNIEGANILEIGTAAGFSASIMAQAAPKARIVTLNPREWEVTTARKHLAPWPNVTVVKAASWDYLETYNGPQLDMVFVDGDHNRAPKDLPWFNHLKVGGLMLFHDYSAHACPAVFRTVDNFALGLERPLNVKIVDSNNIGMAGIVKWDGEIWLT